MGKTWNSIKEKILIYFESFKNKIRFPEYFSIFGQLKMSYTKPLKKHQLQFTFIGIVSGNDERWDKDT